MFLDDVNAVVFQIGQLKSYFGNVGDETPSYSALSSYRRNASNQTFYLDRLLCDIDPSDQIYNIMDSQKIENPTEAVELLKETMGKFQMSVSDYGVLLCLSNINERDTERKSLAELLFEQENCPAVYFIGKQVCSLFSQGRQSGIVTDVGSTHTNITPILEGFVLKSQHKTVSIGGERLTDKLKDLISQKLENDKSIYHSCQLSHPMCFAVLSSEGKSLSPIYRSYTSSVMDFCSRLVVRRIKETLLSESTKSDEGLRRIELPDGREIEVNYFEDPLSDYFNKSQSVDSCQSIQHYINQVIGDIDVDARKNVGSTVILVGGGSLINRFEDTLEQKLGFVGSQQSKVRVVYSSKAVDRKTAGWTGASIMGSTGAFQNMWIGKQEFEEYGESCLARKCLN